MQNMGRFFETFPGDFHGRRCSSGKKSGDVFNDYLDVLDGVACDDSKLHWRLNYLSTYAEYESWEFHMLHGFARCDMHEFVDQSTRLFLALRRVDEEVTRWWHEEMSGKDITCATWHDFNNFLRGCFMSPRRRVPCAKPVTATKFVQRMFVVDKKVQPCATEVAAKDVKTVVPVQTVNAAVTILSEVKQPDVVCADTAVEEGEPLNGLNMQLKKVHGSACMTAARSERWNLFQAQCMINGKACKLMIDSGSYCNGISKAVVEALGLSTWRIPEPRHVEWVNSCGMLKVTHKVRVPFTVGDYVDEVECDVLPLEVCGLYLVDHGSMIAMLHMLGEQIHILLCMVANSRL